MEALNSKKLSLSYGTTKIIDHVDIKIPKGKVTVLVGSNGCGKSTLLRSFARLLKPKEGTILLEGESIQKMPTKKLAKQLAILPQTPTLPEGLTVLQLVRLGRYPHQRLFQQWTDEDEKQVMRALEKTNTLEFAERPVDSLSGGQRQRAWIAMTLAQNTDILLLDEPTTYLDMAHQVEVLDLLFELNRNEGRTIVMVLHDLNLASRYADHMIAICDKQVHSEGSPEEIVTKDMVKEVFRMNCEIGCDHIFGTPVCVPHGRGRCLIGGSCSYRELGLLGQESCTKYE